MSILTDKLPKAIKIGGKHYPIHTDFKCWLKIQQLAGKGGDDFIIKAICLCYKKLPPTFEEAVLGMLDFFQCGEESKGGGKSVFSFEADAKLIYSSFYQIYGIDLNRIKLHWYAFNALLAGLPSDCAFSRAIQFRTVDLSQIKDREQKKYYSKMKNLYRLKGAVDDGEIADGIEEVFN